VNNQECEAQETGDQGAGSAKKNRIKKFRKFQGSNNFDTVKTRKISDRSRCKVLNEKRMTKKNFPQIQLLICTQSFSNALIYEIKFP
jgi:hypothetical protein